MNYNEAIEYILNIPKFSQVLGNDNLIKLLDSLGNPEKCLSYIHIAGTNGKGSVSAMTASALKKAGYRVGLFTSPYIEEFNERIKVNGKNIPDSDLAELITIVRDKTLELSLSISAFAQICAVAFLYFAKEKCDIIVLETGLGGRLDATNVIKSPKAVVITKIGLDHTEWLGETIEEIAREKCGIIKDRVSVFTTKNQPAEALKIIEAAAEKTVSELYICDETDIKTSLSGEYQKENAGICVELLKYLGVNERDIKEGLLSTSWPARFEFLQDNLLIDGGHNPDGIKALISSLEKLKKSVIFVVAMMEDKQITECAKMLDAFAKGIVVTELCMPRCIKAESLSAYFQGAKIIKNPIDAVKSALSGAKNDTIVCVCGSLYLAGEIRKRFR